MKRKKKQEEFYITINDGISYHFVGDSLFLQKSLMLEHCSSFVLNVFKKLKTLKRKNIEINLNQLEDIDSAGVTALYYLKRRLGKHGKKITFCGGKEEVLQKLELFKPEKWTISSKPSKGDYFEYIGTNVHKFFSLYLYSYLLLAANVFYWSFSDLLHSKQRRKGEVANQAVLIGVNATLIVVFMSFVIGLVLALQSSQQLRTFGANIYIVDLTVIGMMSQMGPLITAILVAGRSGSSIAAEIATMKVTSELDALKTMGLNPIRFVVVPKMYACLLTMPFLIVLANIFGIAGGAITSYFYLDITPEVFINRMGSVMKNKDLLTGFVKSQVYASLIVLTGSFYGFRVTKGAEGVGLVTTTAVVVAISLVILADSILGLLFY